MAGNLKTKRGLVLLFAMTLLFGCISFPGGDEMEKDALEDKEASFVCKTVLSSGIDRVSVIPLEKEDDSLAVKSILSSDFDSRLFEKYNLKNLAEKNALKIAETWFSLTQAKKAFYKVEEECEADERNYDRVISSAYEFYETVSDSLDSFDDSVEGMTEMALSVQEELDRAGADDPNYSAEVFRRFNETQASISALKDFHSAVGNSRAMKDVINSLEKEQPFSSLLWVEYFFIGASGLSKLSGLHEQALAFDLVVPFYSDVVSESRSEIEEMISSGKRPKVYLLGSAMKKGVGLRGDSLFKSSFSFTADSLRILEDMESDRTQSLADLEKRVLEIKDAHSRFKSEDLYEINDVVLSGLNELLGKNNGWFEASNTLFTSPKELLENFEEKISEIELLKKKAEKTYALKQDNYLSSGIIDLRLALRKAMVLEDSQEKVVSGMDNIESKARQAYELRVQDLERLVEGLSSEKTAGIDETTGWLVGFAEKELRVQKENVNGSRTKPLGVRVAVLVNAALEIERVKKIVLDPLTSGLYEVENAGRLLAGLERSLLALEIDSGSKEPLFELLYSAKSSLKKAKASAENNDLESASGKALESLSFAKRLSELIEVEFELFSRPVFEKHKKLRKLILAVDSSVFEEVSRARELSDDIQSFVQSDSTGFGLNAIGKILQIERDLLEIESILKSMHAKSSEVISFGTRKKWLFLSQPVAGEVVESTLVLFFSNPFGLIENVLLSIDSPIPYSQVSDSSLKSCTQKPIKTYFLDGKIHLFFEELAQGSHSCSMEFSFVPAIIESEKYLVERATNESADVKLLFEVDAQGNFDELWVNTTFDLSHFIEADFESSDSKIKLLNIREGKQAVELKAELLDPVSLRFSVPKLGEDTGGCVESSTDIVIINNTGFDLTDVRIHFDLPYSGVEKASLKSSSDISGFDYFGSSSNNVFFVLKSLQSHGVSRAEYSFCFDSSDQAKEDVLSALEEKINELEKELPLNEALFEGFEEKLSELMENYPEMSLSEFAVAAQSISTGIDKSREEVFDLKKLSLEYEALSDKFLQVRLNLESFEITEEFAQDLLFADNEFARSQKMCLSGNIAEAIDVLGYALEVIEGSDEFKSQTNDLFEEFQALFESASNLRNVLDMLENPSGESVAAVSNLNSLIENLPVYLNDPQSRKFFIETENSLIESENCIEKDIKAQMASFAENLDSLFEKIKAAADATEVMSVLVKPELEDDVIEKALDTGFGFLVSESAVETAQNKDNRFRQDIELLEKECVEGVEGEDTIGSFVEVVQKDCFARFDALESNVGSELRKRALVIDHAREASESELSLALVELSEKEALASSESSAQLAESRVLLEDSKALFEEKKFATSAFLSRYVRSGMLVLVDEKKNSGEFGVVPWILFAVLVLCFGVYWFRFKKTGEKPVERKRVPRKVFG